MLCVQRHTINCMTTKQCYKCKEVKDITEFNKNKLKNDGHHTVCRECMKKYLQTHYSNNKEYYRTKARNWETFNYNVISSLKANTECCDCGHFYDPVCMDFDHIHLKQFNISSAFRNHGYSLLKILKEIENCELVCANCHRLRTKKRRLVGV